MTITNLDFAELRERDEPGYGLQSLISIIGQKMGFDVESGGRGADKGRDLFFKGSAKLVHGLAMPVKILVSCKDTSKSGKRITVNDIAGFHGRVAQLGCEGFILATTIPPTDDLVTHVQEVAEQNKFVATVWQPDDIKAILLEHQNSLFRFTIARFFPKSSHIGNANAHAFEFFAKALKSVAKIEALELTNQFIETAEDPLLIMECIETLSRHPQIIFEHDLLPVFRKVLALNNDDLLCYALDEIHYAIDNWSAEGLGWKDMELISVELIDDDFHLSFSATAWNNSLPLTQREQIHAVIKWSEGGFSLHELTTFGIVEVENPFLKFAPHTYKSETNSAQISAQ